MSDCIWLRGLHNYSWFVRSTWEKSAAEMHQYSRRHKHSTGPFPGHSQTWRGKTSFLLHFPPVFLPLLCQSFSLFFFLPGGKFRHRQDSVREDLDRCSHGNKWDVAAMTTGIVLSDGVHGPASLPLATNVFLTHVRPHLHFSRNLSLHHNAKAHTTIMTWELSRN